MAPQHDYILDNQNGAQFRADLNLALEAIATVNSGATAPTTTYAYQYWADTTSGYLKQRDASNADWIVRGKLAADYGQAGQVLTSAGADEPAIWTSITEDGAWTVAEDGTSYTFTGNGFDGTETNPTIYVTRGSVYNFTNADENNGFQIQSVAGYNGTAYSDGIVNNPAQAPNASTVETLVWTVQMDAPSELYYHSTTGTSTAGGKIYVLNNIPSSIAATPEIVLEDSLGATAGIEQTAFIRDNDEFKIQTRSATDVLVSTDYNVTLGTSGATSHQWSIDNAEVVRIDSSGNVGIGTSSPDGALQVVGKALFGATGGQENNSYQGEFRSGGNATLKIQAGATNTAYIGLGTTSDALNNAISLNNSTGDLQIRVNSATRQTILANGNVGIGTSSPDELLHIEGDGAEFKGTNTNPISDTVGTEQVFKLGIEGQKNSIYGSAGSIIFRQDATTWSSVEQYQKPTRLELCTQDSSTSDTSETPRLVIDRDGNVGIGTNSPTQKLEINGSAKASAGYFFGSTNSYLYEGAADQVNLRVGADGPYVEFVDIGSNVLEFGNASGELALTSSGTERLRIDSSGSVGIGTSNPDGKLTVQTTGASNGTVDSRSALVIRTDNNTTGTANSRIQWTYGGLGVTTKTYIEGGVNGSDYLAFGNGAGTSEALRINNSGNIGIGTSSPNSELHIAAATPIITIEDTSGATAGVECTAILRNNNNFELQNRSSGHVFKDVFYQVQIDANGANYHQWRIANSEKMRLDSNGNVGIGTSSPAESLHTSGNIRFGDTSPAELYTNSNELRLGVDKNNDNAISDITFYVDDAEKMRIDSDGNVGIGTSSPAGSLNVQGTGAAPSLTYDTANLVNLDQGGIQLAIGVDNASPFTPFLQGRTNTNNSKAITLNPVGGNVGIGTNSPDAKFEVVNSSTGEIEVARFRTEGNTNNPMLRVMVDESTGEAAIKSSGSVVGNLILGSGNNDHLTIDTSGNVGIGTSSPAQNLEVSGTAPRIRITDNNTLAAAGSNSYLEFYGSDARAGIIYTDSTGLNIWADPTGGGNLAFRAGTGEKMRIDGDGNIGIGTSSPTELLEVVATSPTIKSRATGNNSGKLALDSNRAASLIGGQILSQWNGNTVARIDFENGDDDINKDNGEIVFRTSANASNPQEHIRIRSNGVINFANCPTYADDTAAGTGGLVAGDVYKTSTGELRIKL